MVNTTSWCSHVGSWKTPSCATRNNQRVLSRPNTAARVTGDKLYEVRPRSAPIPNQQLQLQSIKKIGKKNKKILKINNLNKSLQSLRTISYIEKQLFTDYLLNTVRATESNCEIATRLIDAVGQLELVIRYSCDFRSRLLKNIKLKIEGMIPTILNHNRNYIANHPTDLLFNHLNKSLNSVLLLLSGVSSLDSVANATGTTFSVVDTHQVDDVDCVLFKSSLSTFVVTLSSDKYRVDCVNDFFFKLLEGYESYHLPGQTTDSNIKVPAALQNQSHRILSTFIKSIPTNVSEITLSGHGTLGSLSILIAMYLSQIMSKLHISVYAFGPIPFLKGTYNFSHNVEVHIFTTCKDPVGVQYAFGSNGSLPISFFALKKIGLPNMSHFYYNLTDPVGFPTSRFYIINGDEIQEKNLRSGIELDDIGIPTLSTVLDTNTEGYASRMLDVINKRTGLERKYNKITERSQKYTEYDTDNEITIPPCRLSLLYKCLCDVDGQVLFSSIDAFLNKINKTISPCEALLLLKGGDGSTVSENNFIEFVGRLFALDQKWTISTLISPRVRDLTLSKEKLCRSYAVICSDRDTMSEVQFVQTISNYLYPPEEADLAFVLTFPSSTVPSQPFVSLRKWCLFVESKYETIPLLVNHMLESCEPSGGLIKMNKNKLNELDVDTSLNGLFVMICGLNGKLLRSDQLFCIVSGTGISSEMIPKTSLSKIQFSNFITSCQEDHSLAVKEIIVRADVLMNSKMVCKRGSFYSFNGGVETKRINEKSSSVIVNTYLAQYPRPDVLRTIISEKKIHSKDKPSTLDESMSAIHTYGEDDFCEVILINRLSVLAKNPISKKRKNNNATNTSLETTNPVIQILKDLIDYQTVTVKIIKNINEWRCLLSSPHPFKLNNSNSLFTIPSESLELSYLVRNVLDGRVRVKGSPCISNLKNVIKSFSENVQSELKQQIKNLPSYNCLSWCDEIVRSEIVTQIELARTQISNMKNNSKYIPFIKISNNNFHLVDSTCLRQSFIQETELWMTHINQSREQQWLSSTSTVEYISPHKQTILLLRLKQEQSSASERLLKKSTLVFSLLYYSVWFSFYKKRRILHRLSGRNRNRHRLIRWTSWTGFRKMKIIHRKKIQNCRQTYKITRAVHLRLRLLTWISFYNQIKARVWNYNKAVRLNEISSKLTLAKRWDTLVMLLAIKKKIAQKLQLIGSICSESILSLTKQYFEKLWEFLKMKSIRKSEMLLAATKYRFLVSAHQIWRQFTSRAIKSRNCKLLLGSSRRHILQPNFRRLLLHSSYKKVSRTRILYTLLQCYGKLTINVWLSRSLTECFRTGGLFLVRRAALPKMRISLDITSQVLLEEIRDGVLK